MKIKFETTIKNPTVYTRGVEDAELSEIIIEWNIQITTAENGIAEMAVQINNIHGTMITKDWNENDELDEFEIDLMINEWDIQDDMEMEMLTIKLNHVEVYPDERRIVLS